ncbi:uncharacterized protein A4U43_C02F900 [Asparagus officinalis]|uniref:Protein YIP n=1 Tax=Asparagus officinalis TaxID=4686 RepID=A0A5P1FJ01_ASPOF|nr:protein YIPF1 homolog isoform X2 [Asparagus officinalis]ONK76889.1 uncharacterized protein A4U43_C02F900 [Asparagus officinalis]
MEEGYTSLPSSHLLGSVPAVITEEKKPTTSERGAAPNAKLQIFPPNNGGYQSPGTPYDGGEQTTSNWKGFFSISSYQPYFNVDSDIVVDRLISSVYPTNDFYRKIDTNPDMYGPVWITTTLVFIFAALGNCATYLIHQRYEQDVIWSFDVTYVKWAASIVYGYALLVPAAFYFLLQYLGTNASLIRLWCMWGYSLFVFIPSSLLLVIPVEFIRWIIIILAGTASSWFIYENLKVYTEESHDLMVLVASALVLQFALAIFVKVFFFV